MFVRVIHSCYSRGVCVRTARPSRETIQFIKRQVRRTLLRSKISAREAEKRSRRPLQRVQDTLVPMCAIKPRDSPRTYHEVAIFHRREPREYVNRASLRTTKVVVVGIEAEATVTSLQIGGGYVDYPLYSRCSVQM